MTASKGSSSRVRVVSNSMSVRHNDVPTRPTARLGPVEPPISELIVPIPEVKIQAAVSAIAARSREAQMGLADAIGEVLLEYCFGGNEENWHRRGPKTSSLHQISKRLPESARYSVSWLSRCLTFHCFLHRHPAVRELMSITPKHVLAVRRLPEPDQVAMLKEANSEAWTSGDLRSRVAARLGKSIPTAHARRPAFVSHLSRIHAMIVDENLHADLDRASDIDSEERSSLLAQLVDDIERLESVLNRVKANPRASSP